MYIYCSSEFVAVYIGSLVEHRTALVLLTTLCSEIGSVDALRHFLVLVLGDYGSAEFKGL